MLESRPEFILKLVIEDYIQTAQPVGSKYLNQQYQLAVSDATVRNELAVLERDGYLRSPHTSAGRVPTEKGYAYYLQHLRDPDVMIERAPFQVATHGMQDMESALKMVAKKLVEISGETVVISLNPTWTYYTGVSNLFQKPDFQEPRLMQTLSTLIDQFDEVLHQLPTELSDSPQVLIGSDNPFGQGMAMILVRYDVHRSACGLLGLLGPIRMNYSRNLALVEQAKEVIDEYCSYVR